ncbi:TRAP transporter small permease [Marinisporobacter balticus]|uniref:TRAP-type C4-dicarboxylate transport system permease small subunit n=1 Tax=Marinisporobacter balticus TaxID=2018667 RepID=A0A4R2KC31_9FIRM|nr:TRAP transporter small permease [Marinisporobacter balticus]TCO67729.1 TRAP-type C4-dicarboxylate transport system permease small subunit [Marinisporobacter balticus]
MNNFLKKFGKDFELYLGSFFLAVTSIIVTMNVFTRYFLKFTYHWAEEIAVGAFVWTIFLGFANAYKTKSLIGVEVLTSILPEKGKNIVELFTSIIITILSVLMFYFSYKYVAGSTKITAALEISYVYINTSMIISFALITVYSIYFSIQSFKKAFLNENTKS